MQGKSGRVEVRTVPKPWGHETIWAQTDRYLGKILHIKAGHSLSIQYHEKKDETIHLLTGEIVYRVQRDSAGASSPDDLENVRLKAGESFRVTPHTVHQLEAVTDCDVLEVSTAHPDDIVRLKDRYGREGTTAP